MNSGITLDYEAADRITLLTLIEILKDTNNMIHKFENTEHRITDGLIEDYYYNKRLRESLEVIINYYGGHP